MADADLLFAGPLDDAIHLCAATGSILGVTAYRSPFTAATYPGRARMDRRACWVDLFARVGLQMPAFTSRHPAGYEADWDPDLTVCPTYFSYGMLILNADQAHALGGSLYDEHHRIREHFSGAHSGQIAFTAAVQRQGLKGEELSIRYNFPNQQPYVNAYPDDFDDLRVLHYMSPKHFDKESDLNSAEQLRVWAADSALDRVHRVLSDHFRSHLEALDSCPWNEIG